MPDINLLAWRLAQKQRLKRSRQRQGLVLLGCGFLSLFLIALCFNLSILKQQAKNKKISLSTDLFSQKMQGLQKDKTEQDAWLGFLKAVKKMQLSNSLNAYLFTKVAAFIQGKGYLTGFTRKDKRVQLIGFIHSSKDLSALIHELEIDPWFLQVRLANLNKEHFKLIFKLDTQPVQQE